MAQGVRVTVSIPVSLQWKCSACGAGNVRVQQISAYGRTNNYDEFLARKKARENLEKTLRSLQSPDVSTRFNKVDFNGKCTRCGNCEPWGKTQSILFVILRIILFLPSCISAYFLIMGFTLMKAGATGVGVFVIPALVVVTCWVVLFLWNKARKDRVQNRICQLPVDSLPIIQIIKPQRPERSGRSAVSAAKQHASDYTDEELKQLPTWKRLEIMKQKENENK